MFGRLVPDQRVAPVAGHSGRLEEVAVLRHVHGVDVHHDGEEAGEEVRDVPHPLPVLGEVGLLRVDVVHVGVQFIVRQRPVEPANQSIRRVGG